MQRQIPIDPKKIRGKYEPPKEDSDFSQYDPIDNPLRKPSKPKTPENVANFKPTEKDTRPTDIESVWLAVILIIGALIIPPAISTLFVFRGSSALAYIVQIALAGGALIFNLQNSHLQEKKFPILGFNPNKLITIIACIGIILGTVNLISWLLSGGY